MVDFERDVAAIMPLIRGFAFKLERDAERAEDLVQETLLAAWAGLRSFRGESTFSTWLLGIMRNKSITNRNARKRIEYGTPAYDVALVKLVIEPNQLVAIELREACKSIDTLSVPHREVLVGMRLLGHSGEELARQAGVAKGTIKSRMSYAHRALCNATE